MARPGTPPAAPDRPAPGASRRRRGLLVAAALLAAIAASPRIREFVRNPDPESLWFEAQEHLSSGRFDEARDALRRIERLRPKSGEDWVLEAQLATAAGQTDPALDALRRVPVVHPLAAQARLLAGRLERQRSSPRLAEAQFLAALEVDPNLVEAHKELIYIYGIQLRRREVDAAFRSLARLAPLSHHDMFTWMTTHFSGWNPDVAEDLQAFIDADPEDEASRLALAEILLDAPGEEARIASLLESFPPDHAAARGLRVGLAIRLGRDDDARARLAEGTEDDPVLARYRGRLAMARRDFDAAASYFRLALSDEPYDRVSCFDLGQALSLGGHAEEARPLLDRARKLNELYNLVNRVRSPERENREADLVQLAESCEAAGLRDEARHWFALAVARDPADARAQKGLYRLREGPPPG